MTILCTPPLDCPSVLGCGDKSFASIHVVPRVTGDTEISWVFTNTTLLAPVRFSVEVNHAGHNYAEDWEEITPPTENIFLVTDPARRSAGWYRKTYYRVVAVGGDGRQITSDPIAANQGHLNPMQQRDFKEILRREQKRYYLKNTVATRGYLLKVKYYGPKCTECIDPDSGEPTTSNCTTCFGVGYIGGYHPPYPCFNVDLTDGQHHLQMYKDQGPMVEGGISKVRYLNMPPVHPWDVWVDDTSDYRYILGKIQPVASFGSIHLVCNAAAGRLSFDHPVYKIDVRT